MPSRLILADALSYAQTHYQPKALINIATLTGAAVVALGDVLDAVYTNDENLFQALYQAGENTGSGACLCMTTTIVVNSTIADVSNTAPMVAVRDLSRQKFCSACTPVCLGTY